MLIWESEVNNIHNQKPCKFMLDFSKVNKFLERENLEKMSKIFAVFLLCVAVASCGGQVVPSVTPPFGVLNPHPTPTPIPFTPCTNCSGVVFVGDSIFGRLTQEPLFQSAGYINSGVFGQRTDEILARLPQVISGQSVCTGYIPPAGLPPDPSFPYSCQTLAQQPKEIVILAGWNNMLQGVDLSGMYSDIVAMVSMARAKGIRVFLCTNYPWDTGRPASWMQPTGSAPVTFYDQWRVPLNASIAATSGVTVVDLNVVFAGQQFYTVDGIHPTFGLGNVQMLNAIESKL